MEPYADVVILNKNTGMFYLDMLKTFRLHSLVKFNRAGKKGVKNKAN